MLRLVVLIGAKEEHAPGSQYAHYILVCSTKINKRVKTKELRSFLSMRTPQGFLNPLHSFGFILCACFEAGVCSPKRKWRHAGSRGGSSARQIDDVSKTRDSCLMLCGKFKTIIANSSQREESYLCINTQRYFCSIILKIDKGYFELKGRKEEYRLRLAY